MLTHRRQHHEKSWQLNIEAEVEDAEAAVVEEAEAVTQAGDVGKARAPMTQTSDITHQQNGGL
jgi:tryptophanyl-tRNA synthetase